eukprot:m.21453 g.21453  ORF g.21453 m.21453 type:complete len:218 (+) comp7151_c0_seq1:645-1298(+)
MDCTSSMGSWINAAKKHVNNIVKGVEEDISQKFSREGNVKVGFVAYRDFNDKVPYDYIDLTADIDAVRTKISEQKADGGGDIPEDPIGGLEIASTFKWRENSCKMIVLVTDAPQHGPGIFHSMYFFGDSHPKCPPKGHPKAGIPHLARATAVMNSLKSQSIRFVFTKLTKQTEKFEKKLMELYGDNEHFKSINLGDKPEAFKQGIEDQVVTMLADLL